MPASPAELNQIKLWARALTQLVEAIEARERAEQESPERDGAPAPRLARIP
jgi:hypothetical protein